MKQLFVMMFVVMLLFTGCSSNREESKPATPPPKADDKLSSATLGMKFSTFEQRFMDNLNEIARNNDSKGMEMEDGHLPFKGKRLSSDKDEKRVYEPRDGVVFTETVEKSTGEITEITSTIAHLKKEKEEDIYIP